MSISIYEFIKVSMYMKRGGSVTPIMTSSPAFPTFYTNFVAKSSIGDALFVERELWLVKA